MRSTTVVLVRHAEQVAHPGDPGLTERGRRQAGQVVASLVPLGLAAIVSSPLLRARRTAQPLATRAQLPVRVEDRLRERVNLEPGVDPEAFLADWRRSVQDRGWAPPKGRSSLRTGEDLLAVVEQSAVRDRTVVLVTHGGAIVDLLRTLLGDVVLQERSPGLLGSGPPHASTTALRRSGSGTWQVDRIAEPAR